MKVIILFPNSFPFGGASTNRVIHIAKGLIESGIETKVLITRSTEKNTNNYNINISGCFEGINFQYLVKDLVWPTNILHRVLVLIKGFLKILLILKKYKKEEIAVISTANYGYISHFILYIFLKIRKYPFIYTVDEFPWRIIHPQKYNRIFTEFYLRTFYKFFDGIVCISQTLLDYYSNKVSSKCKLHLMPMTVEPEKFNCSKEKYLEEYIAYCGYDISYINGKPYFKDGLEYLIRAFHICVFKFNLTLKLYIIGENSDFFQHLVSSLNITDKVKFIGHLSSNEIPLYLCNAKILALTRPDNKQAEGGFPTKLGEYLATGKPVIISKVGDVQQYLTDQVNAFLVEPGNIEQISIVIMKIVNDYVKAVDIGKNGRNLTTTEFSYKIQGKRLSKYLENFYC